MLGHSYEAQNCSAARALEIVGERWSLLILRDALFRGMTRFSDFERSLHVAPNVLAKRLEGFVAARLMEVRPDPERPDRGAYVVTDKGAALKPVIVALTLWGDRWAAPGDPPVVFGHTACGGKIVQHVHCTRCRAALQPADIVARPTRSAGLRR